MRVRPVARKVASYASLFGVDLRHLLALRHSPRFVRDALRYRASGSGRFPLQLSMLLPILTDLDEPAGTARGDYFHQDLWAARRIHAVRPRLHLDVGSRIDGFVAHVLSFMPVTVIDVRPLRSTVPGLTFMQGSCLDLAWIRTSSVPSVSSLHAVEHFGLGRYGDPIAPDAWRLAMRELARILRPGGRLYFSVPVGVERVEFNAHRVFAPATVLDSFRDLELVSLSSIDEDGAFHATSELEQLSNVRYACGLFEFSKPVQR